MQKQANVINQYGGINGIGGSRADVCRSNMRIFFRGVVIWINIWTDRQAQQNNIDTTGVCDIIFGDIDLCDACVIDVLELFSLLIIFAVLVAIRVIITIIVIFDGIIVAIANVDIVDRGSARY